MEFLRNKRWAWPISALGGLALGAAITLGAQSLEGSSAAQSYTHVYERIYAGPNDCLHDTPFDPVDGAFVNLNHARASNENVLSVTPRAANAYKPSVLFFVAGAGKLSPADHFTASFLEQSHCPGAPNGT